MDFRVFEKQKQVNYLVDYGILHNTRKINDLRKESEAHFRISTTTAYNRARIAKRELEKRDAQATALTYVIKAASDAWQNWQQQQQNTVWY